MLVVILLARLWQVGEGNLPKVWFCRHCTKTAWIFSRPYTNGRAYATVLRLSSSVCLCGIIRNVLWLNGASHRAKVTIDSLYVKSYISQLTCESTVFSVHWGAFTGQTKITTPRRFL